MNERDSEAILEEEGFRDNEIDLRQILFTILKHKWSILALAITVSVLTALWALAASPRSGRFLVRLFDVGDFDTRVARRSLGLGGVGAGRFHCRS